MPIVRKPAHAAGSHQASCDSMCQHKFKVKKCVFKETVPPHASNISGSVRRWCYMTECERIVNGNDFGFVLNSATKNHQCGHWKRRSFD